MLENGGGHLDEFVTPPVNRVLHGGFEGLGGWHSALLYVAGNGVLRRPGIVDGFGMESQGCCGHQTLSSGKSRLRCEVDTPLQWLHTESRPLAWVRSRRCQRQEPATLGH